MHTILYMFTLCNPYDENDMEPLLTYSMYLFTHLIYDTSTDPYVEEGHAGSGKWKLAYQKCGLMGQASTDKALLFCYDY